MSIYQYNDYVAKYCVLDIDLWCSKLTEITLAQAQADLYKKIQKERSMDYDCESKVLSTKHILWHSRALNYVKLIIADALYDNTDFNYIAALKKAMRDLMDLKDFSSIRVKPWTQGGREHPMPSNISELITETKLDWPCAGVNPSNANNNSLLRVCKPELAPLGVTIVYPHLPAESSNAKFIKENWQLVEQLSDKMRETGPITLEYDCSHLKGMLSASWPQDMPAGSGLKKLGQWVTLYGATPGQIVLVLTQNSKKMLKKFVAEHLKIQHAESTVPHISVGNFKFLEQAIANQDTVDRLAKLAKEQEQQMQEQQVLARDG